MVKPDPSLLVDVVAPRVLEAMSKASDMLKRAGIRHVVVGGLAVGANGFPRATKDVVFLVGDEAFQRHAGGVVTLNPAVPVQVDGVAVDLLSIEAGEGFLAQALEAEPGSMIDAPPLIYLKLKSPRLKDRVDVVELIKGGVDVERCRAYLSAHAPHFIVDLDDAVRRAQAEDE